MSATKAALASGGAQPVVIDYETFSKIHDCHDRQGLTIAQTARALGLHPPPAGGGRTPAVIPVCAAA
jgi:hypothetical protein